MNGTTPKFAACLLMLLGLAACENHASTWNFGPPRQSLMSGESSSFNASVHTIDPAPESAKNTDIEMNGMRAATAYGRYVTGTVIAPEEIITSDVGED